jgi:hypothetical protein
LILVDDIEPEEDAGRALVAVGGVGLSPEGAVGGCCLGGAGAGGSGRAVDGAGGSGRVVGGAGGSGLVEGGIDVAPLSVWMAWPNDMGEVVAVPVISDFN